MNKKFKQIRKIIAIILFAFGVGLLILVLVVGRNNLTEWQAPITLTFWIYLTLVLIYTLFLNAIPLVWNHFKKNKPEFPKED